MNETSRLLVVPPLSPLGRVAEHDLEAPSTMGEDKCEHSTGIFQMRVDLGDRDRTWPSGNPIGHQPHLPFKDDLAQLPCQYRLLNWEIQDHTSRRRCGR